MRYCCGSAINWSSPFFTSSARSGFPSWASSPAWRWCGIFLDSNSAGVSWHPVQTRAAMLPSKYRHDTAHHPVSRLRLDAVHVIDRRQTHRSESRDVAVADPQAGRHINDVAPGVRVAHPGDRLPVVPFAIELDYEVDAPLRGRCRRRVLRAMFVAVGVAMTGMAMGPRVRVRGRDLRRQRGSDQAI